MPDHLFNDDAIANSDEDRLDRVRFAGRSARLIHRVREQNESAVLGLIGPWGSGKSSVIELIEEQLGDE